MSRDFLIGWLCGMLPFIVCFFCYCFYMLGKPWPRIR